MSRNMYRTVFSAFGGLLFLTTFATSANAQWFGSDPCGSCCPQVCPQPAYRTVPVTEYQEVRQVVQRPVYEKKFVDQDYTEYRPVTETRTAQVPTVQYENVTEMQTVTRDQGYWQTQYRCNPRISPCQYDSRPNLLGWLNRTGYSMRSAFTPRVTTQRQYVPNIVAHQVPVTRQVARRGTRQVSYNVTRMVAERKTRKVAVTNVRYVAEEIVRKQPVTVYRTIPTGSTLAYGIPAYGTSTTRSALAPSADPNFSGSTTRTANSEDNKFQRNDSGTFNEDPQTFNDTKPRHQRKSQFTPIRQRHMAAKPVQRRTIAKTPTAVRVRNGGWVPVPSRNKNDRGPLLTPNSNMSLANLTP